MKKLAASMLGSLLPFGVAVWNERNYFPLNATALGIETLSLSGLLQRIPVWKN